jgi:tetratricopeptide (TPR) repeat protein
MRTGENEPQLLGGHTSAVYSVAFSPNGTRIASSAWDGTVKVWDTATGEEVLTLKGHRDEVRSVAFSPNGALLASAGRDATVRIWDARPWTPAAAIEREAVGLLAGLFAKPLCKGDVLAYLRLPLVTVPAREMALGLIDHYKEETEPERYHEASWTIGRQPYLNAFQYGFALRQAETACRLAPENREYRIALGVAQYRAGKIRSALETLKRAHQHDRGRPAILAFLAMAQHRLARYDQARATLEQLRRVLQQPCWIQDAEMQRFLREAEALISSR